MLVRVNSQEQCNGTRVRRATASRASVRFVLMQAVIELQGSGLRGICAFIHVKG